MKCQKCGKNEASVQYRENINGNIREICLCSDCAKESGLLKKTESIFAGMQREMLSAFAFPFGGRSLLGSMFSSPFGAFPEIGDSFFESDPVEGLEAIEEAPKKEPEKKKAAKKAPETVDELKAQLLDAIADERYEDAAKLRDKIKKLKGE